MKTNKPIYKAIRTGSVAIWDNCDDTLRIYRDHTVATSQYAKWSGNNASLATKKERYDNYMHLLIMHDIANAISDGDHDINDTDVSDIISDATWRKILGDY